MTRVLVLQQRHAFAVGSTFFTLSLLFGSWIARIPEIQARLGLTEGQLGLALLGASAGACCIAPFSGRLLRHWSAGRASLYSTVLFCASMVSLPLTWDRWSLMGALFLVGLTNGLMNIAINAAASAIEEQFGITILSGCHGLFSFGGMIGAATGGLIASMGVPFSLHMACLSLLLIVLNMFHRPWLLAVSGQPAPASDRRFSWPSRSILGLILIGFCIMIGEGAIADWGAVYLRRYLGSGPLLAGLGYAGFSLTMALGRFRGDTLRVRWGSRRLVAGGSLLGAFGLLWALLVPYPALAVLGFALVGAGFSIIVPILYSAAARVPEVKPETGIAAVAASGIIGFLIGPPFIGWLADHLGLPAGLGFVVLLAGVAAITARWAWPEK